MVTSFLASCGAAAGLSAVPQKPHSRNFAGFSSPQLGQMITRSSLGRDPGDLYPGFSFPLP
jgi:hypothetical protein